MSIADEIETKFALAAFEPVRQSLLAAGATRLSRHFEENLVLDTPQAGLRREGILLRLRRDAKATVTLKLAPSAPDVGGLKIRREIETSVSDLAALEAIFGHLGYGVAFRYEKVRETWQAGELHLCLDTLPFGLFLEIEGPAGAIAAMAETLGLSMDAAMAFTYHDLHQLHLKRNGLPPADSFVFAPEVRRDILAGLAQA